MTDYLDPFVVNEKFSSPFIEERLYLLYDEDKINNAFVLVPFYRVGVVVGEPEILVYQGFLALLIFLLHFYCTFFISLFRK